MANQFKTAAAFKASNPMSVLTAAAIVASQKKEPQAKAAAGGRRTAMSMNRSWLLACSVALAAALVGCYGGSGASTGCEESGGCAGAPASSSNCTPGKPGCNCLTAPPYCTEGDSCVDGTCDSGLDAGSQGPNTSNDNGTFGVSFAPEQVTLNELSLRLTNAAGGDVTPAWSGAFATWHGTGDKTDSVAVYLMTPGSTGSKAYPGPRWLKLVLHPRDVPAGQYTLGDWSESSAGSGYLIYVDTDDPALADAIDAAHLDPTSMLGSPVPPGLYWGWGAGSASLGLFEGTVTERGPDLDDDNGELAVGLRLGDLPIELPAGGTLTASGGLQLTAQKAGPIVGTGPGDCQASITDGFWSSVGEGEPEMYRDFKFFADGSFKYFFRSWDPNYENGYHGVYNDSVSSGTWTIDGCQGAITIFDGNQSFVIAADILALGACPPGQTCVGGTSFTQQQVLATPTGAFTEGAFP